jgi:hypothetical protein
MPVVFTSLLDLPGERGEGGGERIEGEVIYSISQMPQVWIDHQVFERGGELVYRDSHSAPWAAAVNGRLHNSVELKGPPYSSGCNSEQHLIHQHGFSPVEAFYRLEHVRAN